MLWLKRTTLWSRMLLENGRKRGGEIIRLKDKLFLPSYNINYFLHYLFFNYTDTCNTIMWYFNIGCQFVVTNPNWDCTLFYSQTCIKRSPYDKEKVVLKNRWLLKWGSFYMKLSMTGHEKGDPLIQVTA